MNKHAATHDGHTWKRNSKGHSYTHTVIVVTDIAAARADCERTARASFRDNLEYTTALAKGGVYDFGRGLTKVITAQEQAEAQAILDGGVEAYVAARLARFDAYPILRSSDGLKAYSNAGWCSRLDLARKLQAKHPGSVIVQVPA